MTGQSFSVQPSSLRAFAQELQTQLSGIAAPMDKLAAQHAAQPQFGGFAEAATLAQSQQSAVQDMYELLEQVKQAIGFAGNVTDSIATAYQNGDQNAAASYTAVAAGASAPSTTTTAGQGATTTAGQGTMTTSGSGTTTAGSGTPVSQGG
jgi:hypothetical protein